MTNLACALSRNSVLLNDTFLVVYKIAVCKIKCVDGTSLCFSTVKPENKS